MFYAPLRGVHIEGWCNSRSELPSRLFYAPLRGVHIEGRPCRHGGGGCWTGFTPLWGAYILRFRRRARRRPARGPGLSQEALGVTLDELAKVDADPVTVN